MTPPHQSTSLLVGFRGASCLASSVAIWINLAMQGVLTGFSIILVIIGIGYIAARAGLAPGDRRLVLNQIAFYVATPALLFTVLSTADVAVLASPVMLTTALAALIAAGLFVLLSRWFFPKDLASTALGATAAGYVNSNNIGLPVAIYILGEATYVAPLLLVQLVVFTPVILTLLEASKGKRGGLPRALLRAATNPIILGSVAGVVVSILDWTPPIALTEPLSILGGASIPMVLLSFGMSLHGQKVLQQGSGLAASLTSTALKVIGMPLVALLVGAQLFNLGSQELFAAVVISALPTAQNVYNYAATYQRGETLVRDTVFLSTFASFPVILLISLFLAPGS